MLTLAAPIVFADAVAGGTLAVVAPSRVHTHVQT